MSHRASDASNLESRVTVFIAALSPSLTTNWEICVQESLWGVVGRGTNWRKNALNVRAHDRILIWRGGSKNGFIAEVEALGPCQMVDGTQLVPWPDAASFGAVIPIRVLREWVTAVGDSFNTPDRNGRRFGFNNTVLQHVIEEIPQSTAQRIYDALPSLGKNRVGAPFKVLPPKPSPDREVIVDPDAIDRGLEGHYATVLRLAKWVERQGLVPMSAARLDPQYDLAWWDASGSVLNVAEVKSVNAQNVEMQLRLGLGQVLRYRHALRERGENAAGWLVPERVVADPSWKDACAAVEISLFSPPD